MRRNLVIVRAGNASLHPAWLSDNRSWDIIVNYFGDDPDIYKGPDIRRIDSKGPKWPALYELMATLDADIKGYEYIWFPDDDLACTPYAIEKFFGLCREHALELAQPSLTYDSHIGVSITLHNHSFKLRHTNFIEIMAPCFSQTFLKRCWPSFNTSYSGWGLDFVWPRWASAPDKVAIIDAVQIHHTRPHGGPNYNLLKERGIDPDQELHALLKREGIKFEHVITGGITLNGQHLGLQHGNLSELIHHIMVGYLPQFTNYPELLYTILAPTLESLKTGRV